MSRNENARAAALEMLVRCRRDASWSGAAIDAAVRKYGLDRRDAALASRLCLGVLQNESLCDYYIVSAFCRMKACVITISAAFARQSWSLWYGIFFASACIRSFLWSASQRVPL